MSNCTKLQDHLPDPNAIFTHEWLTNPEIKITISLLHYEQKEAIFKLPIQAKIERVKFLKNISAQFFQADKFDKAFKIFKRIDNFFTSKDAFKNYTEENEQLTTYRDAKDALQQMQVSNLTNLALVLFKQLKNTECIEACNRALEIDHRCSKALYWKARANTEEAEYDDAIKGYQEVLEIDAGNSEARKWLKETINMNNAYQQKIKLLAKKMFE